MKNRCVLWPTLLTLRFVPNCIASSTFCFELCCYDILLLIFLIVGLIFWTSGYFYFYLDWRMVCRNSNWSVRNFIKCCGKILYFYKERFLEEGKNIMRTVWVRTHVISGSQNTHHQILCYLWYVQECRLRICLVIGC